jgi:hypothetical protein
MPRFTKLIIALRAALASTAALSIASATQVEAQSEVSEASIAYQQAKEVGTIEALERFIEQYPLSPEANDAFRDIVLLSRRSRLANQGPLGLPGSSGILTRSEDRSLIRSVAVY